MTEAGTEPVIVPGRRDVRGVLDTPGESGESSELAPPGRPRRRTELKSESEPNAVVVACPPHPQQGGSRADARLTGVSAALGEHGIACLRFDYGPWDGGDGERLDTRNACRWAAERYDRVGLFGYSFGATTALCVAGETEGDAPGAPNAVSVLAPDRGDSDTERDALAALDAISSPVQVCYGERDTTVEWEPVVERARERGFVVESIPADHFFVGRKVETASCAASFFTVTLR